MYDEPEEKKVSIEPLPETKKKKGRQPISPSKRKPKPSKTAGKEVHIATDARKKHYKKMQVARVESAKKKRLQKEEALNSIIKDKKMGYVVNPVDNGTSEQSLVDASINIPPNVIMTQYSNLEKQQQIFQHQLQQFGETFNKLDNYLLSIGVKTSDGSGNSDHILMQGPPQIIQHNDRITPYHKATDPSPFVPSGNLSFRERLKRKQNP